MKTEAVIFDMGGVLAQDVWEHLFLDEPGGIAAQYALDRDTITKVGEYLWECFAYVPETAHNDYQTLEERYWKTLIGLMWGGQPPATVSAAGFIQMTDDFVIPIEGMDSILDRLQRNGVDLAICSNNTEFWIRRQMDKCNLYRFFSPGKIILSCRVGVSKSSAHFEMFHSAVDALMTRRAACLFVDDRSSNVQRAQQCGMDSVRFTTVQQLQQDLQTRGLI